MFPNATTADANPTAIKVGTEYFFPEKLCCCAFVFKILRKTGQHSDNDSYKNLDLIVGKFRVPRAGYFKIENLVEDRNRGGVLPIMTSADKKRPPMNQMNIQNSLDEKNFLPS